MDNHVCPTCGSAHYRQLKVGAGALIERDGALLLLQRLHEPFRMCWNLPAGYVEADEHPAEATVRETREETGLEVDAGQLVDVYFYDDDPRGSGILIVYGCHVTGGRLRDTSEAVNATYFTPGEVPEDLAGGGHDQAIRAWQERRRKS